jgi:uncharacterized membrane protein
MIWADREQKFDIGSYQGYIPINSKGGNRLMRKRRWLIPMVLSIVLVGGIAGGVMVAADDSSGTVDQQSQLADRHEELLDRACAIYRDNTGTAIDSEQFRAALEQAQGELQEKTLESRVQDLVNNGKITQEVADQYLEWWQSRPDIQVLLPGLGGPGHRGGMMGGSSCGPWGGSCPGPGASGETAGE